MPQLTSLSYQGGRTEAGTEPNYFLFFFRDGQLIGKTLIENVPKGLKLGLAVTCDRQLTVTRRVRWYAAVYLSVRQLAAAAVSLSESLLTVSLK